MNKHVLVFLTIGALAVLAVVGLFVLDQDGTPGTSDPLEKSAERPEPLRDEVVQQPSAPPPEPEAPVLGSEPEKEPEKILATDYERPEDVPWIHFYSKDHALTLRPWKIDDDGTRHYAGVPMLERGKRTFGTMTAKPTAPLPINPDELPDK